MVDCTLCGGKTHDVSKKYGAEAHECENCGYLGKEIDEFG